MFIYPSFTSWWPCTMGWVKSECAWEDEANVSLHNHIKFTVDHNVYGHLILNILNNSKYYNFICKFCNFVGHFIVMFSMHSLHSKWSNLAWCYQVITSGGLPLVRHAVVLFIPWSLALGHRLDVSIIEERKIQQYKLWSSAGVNFL